MLLIDVVHYVAVTIAVSDFVVGVACIHCTCLSLGHRPAIDRERPNRLTVSFNKCSTLTVSVFASQMHYTLHTMTTKEYPISLLHWLFLL